LLGTEIEAKPCTYARLRKCEAGSLTKLPAPAGIDFDHVAFFDHLCHVGKDKYSAFLIIMSTI